MWINGNDD
jgi:hypothetical protein